MKTTGRKTSLGKKPLERCDTKVWSGDCRHDDYTTSGDKYLCVTCGTIRNLDHEVKHESFPHIVGDEDNLY